jgi:hypothetical protein
MMKNLYRFLAILMVTMLMAPWLALAADDTKSTDSESTEVTCENSETVKCSESTASAYTGTDKKTVYMCTGGNYDKYVLSYTVDLSVDGDKNEETKLVSTKISEFEELYNDNIGKGTCGTKVNPLTGSLEMSDCADEKKVVTELSESFAGDTKLYSTDESGKKTVTAEVVTVYRGACCLIVESVGDVYECKDVRKLYYPSADECNAFKLWSCERRQWVIGENGASIIKVYVKQIYMWAAGTIGFIAVFTIVLNGIRITLSGVSGDLTQAKERILQSISGLVLLFLSGLILYTINPTFFS